VYSLAWLAVAGVLMLRTLWGWDEPCVEEEVEGALGDGSISTGISAGGGGSEGETGASASGSRKDSGGGALGAMIVTKASALAVCPSSSVTKQVTITRPGGAPSEEKTAEAPLPRTEPADAE
jgi:hypothetical protein